jgi:hypothetical protein
VFCRQGALDDKHRAKSLPGVGEGRTASVA